MTERTVTVGGLAEFRRELRQLGTEWPRALGQAHRRIATEVAGLAVDRAAQVGRMEHAAAVRGLKPRARQSDARITLDATAAPWIFGAEFGAFRYHQFKPWRGSGEDAGYFLWPTIRDNEDQIVEMYADEIDQLAAAAFPS